MLGHNFDLLLNEPFSRKFQVGAKLLLLVFSRLVDKCFLSIYVVKSRSRMSESFFHPYSYYGIEGIMCDAETFKYIMVIHGAH